LSEDGPSQSSIEEAQSDKMMPRARQEIMETRREEKKAVDEDKLDDIESLRKALKEEQERANEYLSRFKYLQADFENYQKRTKKEMAEIATREDVRIIGSLLEVVDDLERAVKVGDESNDKKALIGGVRIILNEMKAVLHQEGLSEMETVGKPFDPYRHQAASHVATSDQPENTIVGELRKGYLLHGEVVRPAIVEVAKRIEAESDE